MSWLRRLMNPPTRTLLADARAENECFQAGHPLVGHACACGLVRFAKEDTP